jgi:hypothetical protein
MPRSDDPETLEKRRRQTANGRKALAAKFPTSEARRIHLSRAGRIGNERRRVLSGDEVAAFGSALRALEAIAKKHRILDESS